MNARTSIRDGRQGGWIGWGGTNRSDKGLNLSGSWQQGRSQQTPWSVFQDGSNGEPTGQRLERADAEACRRRALPATINDTAFHERIEILGFGRPSNPHWFTPRVDRHTGSSSFHIRSGRIAGPHPLSSQ
ncbi:hypothetical protein CQW23_33544 [Capsicum baccatum]|uniref:Uncharacterized protein n=1 Tax=Capsicum baccatum TaxID=33114 RepID=A0A2G2V1G9_CAPBA|nr:hypothetical protein CQW23_33544 [Capsicum baccatum]